MMPRLVENAITWTGSRPVSCAPAAAYP